MENNHGSCSPHVLIFPLPVQGHITPMLNLAELLCIENFQITFLITTQMHQRLTNYTDTEARFAKYAGFRFKMVPAGPPTKQWSSHEDLKDWLVDLVQGLAINAKPLLEEMLRGSDVTCLVVDGWLSFVYDVAKEGDTPVILFRCPSACCMWAYFCTPKLIEAGEVPFQDEEDNMSKLVQNARGLDTFLRYRDLPRFCREKKDTTSCRDLQQYFAEEIDRTKKTHALILNTCEDLEGPLLDLIRSRCPKTYSIGPLHAHLKTRLNHESSSGLWEVDRSCISWLDQKPDKSVLYVSFGSITMLEREQLIEIWAGLVQSRIYFLWAIRPNLMIGSDELLGGTEDRGYIVGWVPQEEVLAHRAVGGFLTHSGWNSTLESITAGVPMLCWPYFGDQQVNSRCVSEVWRVGLDMKDTCDRDVVAKMVGDLMVERKFELQASVARVSGSVNRNVTEGCPAYCNLDSLIKNIQQMIMKDTT